MEGECDRLTSDRERLTGLSRDRAGESSGRYSEMLHARISMLILHCAVAPLCLESAARGEVLDRLRADEHPLARRPTQLKERGGFEVSAHSHLSQAKKRRIASAPISRG